MAWCKLSSLTAAVVRVLKEANFPMSRSRILSVVEGRTVEGWDLNYFLAKALKRKKYNDIREVMSDLDEWLETQG
jgi:hypothetical protein